MRKRCKTRLCLLLALCMAALFLPQSLAKEQPGTPTDLPEGATVQRQQSPTATDSYDKAVYSENDVNVINAIIESNGLKAQKDDPENWRFATWDKSTIAPKRITKLRLISETLTGSLNVSGLSSLGALDCNNNQLTSLEVSGLTALTSLVCYSNRLDSLEVGDLPALTKLSCANNNFNSLDLTGVSSGIQVNCSLDQLTDRSGKMVTVGTAENGFAQIIRYGQNKDGGLQLGIQAYPQRGYVMQEWNDGKTDNPLSFTPTQPETTVTPSFIAETDSRYHQEDLDFLDKLIADQQLDGEWNIRLGYPDTYGDITDWQENVSTNKRLTKLKLYGLGLTGSLKVSGLPELTYLDCDNSQLTSLEVSGLAKLENLYCSNNQLSSLEVSGIAKLERLFCNNNQLSSLDVSGLSVTYFNYNDNPISNLVLAGGKSITISVTGSGRPWLADFEYNKGEPQGVYLAKPAAGYGNAAWSKENGCTIANDNSLTFDFANNGGVSTVSADLTFTRTEPLTADPNTVELTGEGVQPGGQVQKGSTFTFTANPIETGAPYPISGDVRYMPESWSVNPSGDFTTGYTQTFSTADMALGNHALTVTYRMQKYNGAKWEPVTETIEKTLSFTLVAQDTPGGGDTPGGNTPGGNTPGGGQNGSNGANGANPGTGDSGYAWYIIGLALAGGAMLLMARKKKTA